MIASSLGSSSWTGPNCSYSRNHGIFFGLTKMVAAVGSPQVEVEAEAAPLQLAQDLQLAHRKGVNGFLPLEFGGEVADEPADRGPEPFVDVAVNGETLRRMLAGLYNGCAIHHKTAGTFR